MDNYIDEKVMLDTARKLCNWGKWGPNDQIGTLNYVTKKEVASAAKLVKEGKVFSLGMDFNSDGPQTGKWGRVNPIHLMYYTGTDSLCGSNEKYSSGIYSADDYIIMPTQCATHWDAVGHIFSKNYETGKISMWNGYDPSNVDSIRGITVCGIQETRDRMVGRGVLLDIASFKKVAYMEPGQGITAEDLDACAKAQNVEIRRGDFLLIRTGDLGRRLKEKNWGCYNAGDAPGVEFETIFWMHDKEIAAVAQDTWGVEVRPNRIKEGFICFQPWHQICIPIVGLTHGENFVLDALADDCASDGRYEFLFVAPPINITNGGGTPLNPQAIK